MSVEEKDPVEEFTEAIGEVGDDEGASLAGLVLKWMSRANYWRGKSEIQAEQISDLRYRLNLATQREDE